MHAGLRSSFFRYIAQTSPEPDGFQIKRGDGIYLYDQEDRAYIDCNSGIAVSSLGHRHPAVQEAIRTQLDLHLHTMVYGEHIQPIQVQLAEKIASLLPPSLSQTFFTNSGAEAVEGAIKLARKYTGRIEIIACRHAYHGSTAGAESLRSDLSHTSAFRPLVPGVKHIDFSAIGQLENITEKTACVIVEPIQGEAGVIIPDSGYLAALSARCKEVGALCIADEIQTGMGRAGALFAFQHENFIPDVLLLAKAFGGGLPLGAFIADPSIMRCLSQDPILGHLTTFGGHPLSCAAALAALRVTVEEKLSEKAEQHGRLIKSLIEKSPHVHEVRQRGLMMAVELKDPTQLLPTVAACRNEGILVDWFLFNDRSIRLYPPLIIDTIMAELISKKILTAIDGQRTTVNGKRLRVKGKGNFRLLTLAFSLSLLTLAFSLSIPTLAFPLSIPTLDSHSRLSPLAYNSFLNRATGILSCSRYLATVRRAML